MGFSCIENKFVIKSIEDIFEFWEPEFNQIVLKNDAFLQIQGNLRERNGCTWWNFQEHVD